MKVRAITFAIGMTASVGCLAACSVRDVDVKLVRFYDEGGMHVHFAVVGELTNKCAEPIGAQVRFTARDAKGGLVAVAEQWPASIRNIAPGAKSPFQLSPIQYDRAVKTIEAEVIAVRRW